MLYKTQSMKIISITYVAFFYTIASYFTSVIYRIIDNKITGDEHKSKSTLRLICELLLSFVIMIQTMYFTKLIVQQIRNPLDGIYQYNHNHFTKSFLYGSCETIAAIWLMSDTSIQSKINLLNTRLHTTFL